VTRAARSTAGFTLLEVAVALAILGVGIVTVLRIFSGSLHLQDRASRETRVVLHARAAMDALLFQPEIADHTEERTTAEGFLTRILVRHAGPDEGVAKREFDTHSDMALRYLQVDVVWQDGAGAKTYTLKSLRWAPENE
jgi:prepilin-type N-terminal cleavage/methylation domain-containing protein